MRRPPALHSYRRRGLTAPTASPTSIRRWRRVYESAPVALRPVQILRRIDRRRAFADFEVKLRRSHISGLTGMRDHLAAFHRFAALDQDVAGVGVGGDEAVTVTHQHQIAVALELVAGIGDDAAAYRPAEAR